ncbi:hypothetical protein [Streptomyces sp. FH025]|uniref:hypothetical protein n=1 Tax=Streptomyces sp. FH025 TaxID=2815937 RepID=UPI001A9E577D|nr:hypothetical protein [Streptomyces sp. FH025]MBO1419146.1 hypothetical protein [Streptomyces sp. FH025]
MSQTSKEDHYAGAALRHHSDAVYLHDDGRLPNADHHFGFAVECALKSLMLRYTRVSVAPIKPGGQPTSKPYIPQQGGKPKYIEHLPEAWSDAGDVIADAALLLNGRTGGALSAILAASTPFATWSVHDRYSDGSSVIEADVRARRAASELILGLHERALIDGVLT